MGGARVQERAAGLRERLMQPLQELLNRRKPSPERCMGLKVEVREMVLKASSAAEAWRQGLSWAGSLDSSEDRKAAMKALVFQMLDKRGSEEGIKDLLPEINRAASTIFHSIGQKPQENMLRIFREVYSAQGVAFESETLTSPSERAPFRNPNSYPMPRETINVHSGIQPPAYGTADPEARTSQDNDPKGSDLQLFVSSEEVRKRSRGAEDGLLTSIDQAILGMGGPASPQSQTETRSREPDRMAESGGFGLMALAGDGLSDDCNQPHLGAAKDEPLHLRPMPETIFKITDGIESLLPPRDGALSPAPSLRRKVLMHHRKDSSPGSVLHGQRIGGNQDAEGLGRREQADRRDGRGKGGGHPGSEKETEVGVPFSKQGIPKRISEEDSRKGIAKIPPPKVIGKSSIRGKRALKAIAGRIPEGARAVEKPQKAIKMAEDKALRQGPRSIRGKRKAAKAEGSRKAGLEPTRRSMRVAAKSPFTETRKRRAKAVSESGRRRMPAASDSFHSDKYGKRRRKDERSPELHMRSQSRKDAPLRRKKRSGELDRRRIASRRGKRAGKRVISILLRSKGKPKKRRGR